MPRPPATPTGSPGWSGSWRNPPTPPGASTRSADGWPGSRTRGWSSATRRSPSTGPGCTRWWASRRRRALGRRGRAQARSPAPSPTAAPPRARWRCCGPCCAATASIGCAPTPDRLAGLNPGSQWRPTAILLEGIGYLLDGQADRADPILAHAAEVATEASALPAAAIALAERSIVAMHRDDWDQADTLAEQALGILRAGRLDDYVTSAAGLRGGGPDSRAPGRPRPGPRAARPGRSPPAPAHLRPAPLLGPDAAGAGPGLPGPGRRRRRQGGPAPGPRHPPAAARPRAPAQPGRGAALKARHRPRQAHRGRPR